MAVNLGSVVAHLELDTSKYISSLKSAQEQMAQFSNSSLTGMEKLSAVGNGLTSVGSTLTKGLTLPLLGVAAASTKVGMDFQSAMSSVQALSGATADEMEMLEETARSMAQETIFSATEAAEALGYMSLAGWNATESAEGLEHVLKLAGAANMDLARASDVVTDVLSAYSMEVEEAGRLTDVLAYAQANSNTSVDELAEGFKYAAAGANAMGYDVEDTSAILGLLADNMLKGSIGGTTLNSMFRDMKKNSENGAIAIGSTNVAIVDANGNYRDFAAILADVEKATEGMTQAERDAAVSKIWGTEAQKGMNILLAEGSETLMEFEDGLRGSEGAASDMYDMMNDNLKGAIEGFKSSLEEAGLSIFETLEPALMAVVSAATKMIDGFVALPGPVKAGIVIFGGFLAILGPLLIIAGQFALAIVNINSALALVGGASGIASAGLGLLSAAKGMAATAGGLLTGALTGVMASAGAAATAVWALIAPLLPIVAAIAAVIAIGVLLYKNWDTIKEKAGQLAGWLGDKFSEIGSAIGGAWDSAKEKTSEAWAGIRQTVEDNGGGLEGVLRTVMDNMHWVWLPGLSLLDHLTGGHMKQMAMNMRDSLISLPSRMKEAGADAIQGLIDGIKAKAREPVDFIRNLGGEILRAFQDRMNINSPSVEMYQLGTYATDGLVQGLSHGETAVSKASSNLGTGTLQALKNSMNLGEFEAQGIVAIDSVARGVESGGDALATTTEETLRKSFNEALEGVQDIADIHGIDMSQFVKDADKAGEKVADDFAEGMDAGAQNVEESAENLAQVAQEKLDEAKDRVNTLGGAIENALKEKYKRLEEIEVGAIERKLRRLEESSRAEVEQIKAGAKIAEDAVRRKIKDLENATKQEVKILDDLIKQAEKESKAKIELIQKTRDARLKALDDKLKSEKRAYDARVKQVTDHERAETRVIDESLKNETRASKMKISSIQKVRDERIKAIDAQRRAEKRAADERIKELQKLERAETRTINARIEAVNRSSKAEIDALNRAARLERTAIQARIRETQRASSQQIDNIRATERIETESLNRRINAVKRATDERIKQYDREYNEQLKVIDREMYDQINAVQKQIDVIDEATKREQFALDQQAHNAKVAELQKKIAVAKSTEERMRLTKELNDTIAAWERRMLLDSREREKEALREKMDEIRSSFEARKEILRQEVEDKKSAEKEKLDAIVQTLEEEIAGIKEAADVKAAEEEKKREEIEETLKAQIEQSELMLEDAKKAAEQKAQAAIDALKEELQEYKDSIEDKIENEKKRVDALEEGFNKEKDHINELSEAQKEAEEKRIEQIKDNAAKEKEEIEDIARIRKEAEAEKMKALEESFNREKEQIKSAFDAQRETEQKKQESYRETMNTRKDAINQKATLQKEAYQAEIEQINKTRDAEVKAQEDKLKGLRDGLNKRKDAVKSHYAELTQADNLRHETAKMLQRKNSNEIMELLKEYNPKWQSQGQDYASMLSEGIRSELVPMMEDIEEALDIDFTELRKSLDDVSVNMDNADDSARGFADGVDAITGAAPIAREEIEKTGKSIFDFTKDTGEHKGIIETFGKAVGNIFKWLKGDVEDSTSSMSLSIDSHMSSSGKSFEGLEVSAKNSLGNVVTETNKTPTLMAKSGSEMGARLTSSFAKSQARMAIVTASIARATANGLRSMPSQMTQIGRNFGTSLAQGIRSQISAVAAAARQLAQAANAGVRERLKINSPSRVGIENGEFFGEGLGLGILNSVRDVQRNAMALADGAVETMNNALVGSQIDVGVSASKAGGGQSTSSTNPTSNETVVNLHVGTLVADEQGLKQLERKLRSIRLVEDSRFGGVTT